MAIIKKTIPKGGKRKRIPKERESTFPIALPKKANSPPDELTAYSLCIFGVKGIGKSSLAAQMPGALSFMWERGRRNLPIKQIPDPRKREPPLTWSRFVTYRDAILSLPEKGRPKAVIQDTVDKAYDACVRNYCRNAGIRHPSDMNDFGASWNKITEEFSEVMLSFLNEGITPVYLSHAKVKDVGRKTGKSYDLIVPTCNNQALDFLKETVDIVFYYDYIQRQRSLHVRGDDLVWSACGVGGHFLDPDGEELLAFPVGNTPREAWGTLQEAWNNEIFGWDADAMEPEAEEEEE